MRQGRSGNEAGETCRGGLEMRQGRPGNEVGETWEGGGEAGE